MSTCRTSSDSTQMATTQVTDVVTEEADEDQVNIRRSTWEITIIFALILFFMLTSVFGNCLVIAAIRASTTLRDQVSNLFIINLSITDSLTALTVMMTSIIALVSNTDHINSIWCGVICGANYCFIIVSMTTLSSISLDRYCAVLHPLHYPEMVTRRRITVLCAYLWIQGLAFAIPPLYLNWVRYDYWEVICAINWKLERTIIYVIVAFIINFAIPGALMVFSYFHIIREARRGQSRISTATGTSSSRDANKGKSSETKITLKMIRSLIIVVACFFICMTPFCVTKLLKVAVSNAFVPGYANVTASLCQFMSSSLNPLIYGIFRADFRRAYYKIFKKMPCEICHPSQMPEPTG